MIWQRRYRKCTVLIGLLGITLLSTTSNADNSDSWRAQTLRRNLITLTVPADSIITIPNIAVDSIAVVCSNGSPIERQHYEFHNGYLRFSELYTDCDTLIISLIPRTHQLGLSFRLREFESGQRRLAERGPVSSTPATIPRGISNNKLQVQGTKSFYADVSDRSGTSLSQGLSLSLNGEIGNGVIVRGSFSDQGLRNDRLVTRRFSELENVYLEAESEKLRGRFGSFVLEQDNSRFLRLTRKIQGLQFGIKSDFMQSNASVGVPQGNFTSNTFLTSDGDYGPYRLRDNSGVPDVAVVENSEAVWLNGIRLERGRDRDYYLDYPRGELFFTGSRSIDADDRVRVEFESVRLEYRKTVVVVDNTVGPAAGDFSIGLGYVGLLEYRNDPLDFALDESDILALESAGDDPDLAIVPGATFVGLGDGEYRLEVNVDGDSVYVFAGEGEGDYRVSFTEHENGDYIYLGNGRYQYVGAGQGRYLPLRPLPLPARTHLTSATANYKADNGVWGRVESAFSHQDRNLFSSLDDGDNASVAFGMQAGVKSPTSANYATVEAEYLPAQFARLQRFEAIDEEYLWQRTTTPVNDRQRYSAGIGGGVSRYDNSQLEVGYTREGNSFESQRFGWLASVDSIANSRATWRLDLASSDDGVAENRLVRIKPQLRNSTLPVVVQLAGEFDLRRQNLLGIARSNSKREGELGAEYGGLTLFMRQRENWNKIDEWRMLDRKRTLRARMSRRFAGGNEVNALMLWNRYDPGSGVWEEYQTGSLKMVLLRLVNLMSVSADYRLSRRGSSQTNQTFLRVDDGAGDYVLVDSVYVPQERGDYLLVTEQVGDLSQSTEAEKHLRFDFEPGRLTNFVLLRESSFRYEVNFREIGSPQARFASRWLLPSLDYFEDATRFSRIEQQYQWRRKISSIGLRAELSAKFRVIDNDFDIDRPRLQTSEEARFLLSKTFNRRDNLELELNWRNNFDEHSGDYMLWLRRRGGRVSTTHFRRSWEYALSFTAFRERADSLSLEAVSLRLEPGLNYNLGELGRIETSLFAHSVSEREDREVLLQMADNFPRGSHWGGRVRVEINLGRNFSFRLLGRAEMLSARDNRYFLRTELISRFQ